MYLGKRGVCLGGGGGGVYPTITFDLEKNPRMLNVQSKEPLPKFPPRSAFLKKKTKKIIHSTSFAIYCAVQDFLKLV